MSKGSPIVCIRIPAELLTQLDRLAAEASTSRAALIKEAIIKMIYGKKS